VETVEDTLVMYVHRQIRHFLTPTSKNHHRYIIIIIVCIIFLFLMSVRQGKLRNINTDNLEEEDDGQNVIIESDADYVTDEERSVLTKSFQTADFDGDKLLSQSEITMAISRETKQHILQAMRNNFRVFFSLDKMHKNGQVDWEEYFSHYVRDLLGLDEETIKQIQKKPQRVSRDIKESLARLKAAWSEAARTNPDAVNIDEFLGLEHPESSHSFLTQRVDELMGKFDTDDDGKLSRAEYLQDPYRDLSGHEVQSKDKEFNDVLDKNHDGVADKKEIVQFLDPKNPHWAKDEAISLIRQADKDKDKMVSLEEMIAKPDLFLMSKLVSADLSFHGEF